MVNPAAASTGFSIPFPVVLVVSVAVGLGLLYLDYRNWRRRGR